MRKQERTMATTIAVTPIEESLGIYIHEYLENNPA
jgi:hypothetical protein